MKNFLKAAITSVLLSSLALTGCDEQKPTNKSVYLLLDTSGTYTKELDKAQSIMNYLLATLDSGDSIACLTEDGKPIFHRTESRHGRVHVSYFEPVI